MEIWLQTRGITRDYAFLGTIPPERWWASTPYKDATSFELPSLIFEWYEPDKWHCFISGIPSARRDRVNTPIRYSLALDGSSDTENDIPTLRKLLTHVLYIFHSNPAVENTALTKIFDDTFGNETDDLLDKDKETAQKLVDGLSEKFKDLTDFDCDDVFKKNKEKSPLKTLEKIFNRAQNSARSAVMLNFIASDKDPLVSDLQSHLDADKGTVMVMPSPVAGGKISNSFLMTPPPRAQLSVVNTTVRTNTEKKTGLPAKTLVPIIAVLVFLGGSIAIFPLLRKPNYEKIQDHQKTQQEVCPDPQKNQQNQDPDRQKMQQETCPNYQKTELLHD